MPSSTVIIQNSLSLELSKSDLKLAEMKFLSEICAIIFWEVYGKISSSLSSKF